MRFDDPAGLIGLELPPGWAVDPASSRLFQRVLARWAEPGGELLFAELCPQPVGHGAGDAEWAQAVRTGLPADAAESQVEPGAIPVVWVARPGREGRPDQRWAVVRGRAVDVTLEHVGVPLGGPIRTPALERAVATLDVPVNRRLEPPAPGATWNALMDRADAALAAGDAAGQRGWLTEALTWIRRAWLRGVREGQADSSHIIALAHTRLSLAESGDAATLADTAELVLRLASFADDQPQAAESLRQRVFAVCGRVTGKEPPSELWQAYLDTADGAARAVLGPAQAGSPPPAIREADAETVMRLAASTVALTRQLRSSGDQAPVLARRRGALTTVVAAGLGLQAALGASARFMAPAVADEWLAAARLLRAEDSAGAPTRDALVSALIADAGSRARSGDAPALEQEEALLAEARGLFGDDEKGPLRDQLWLVSAWSSVQRGQPDEALERAGRITASTAAMGWSKAAVEATALRLLGRREDALAAAEGAVGPGDPSDSAHRVILALSLADAGRTAEAVEQARAGLASALAENPVEPPVVSALLVLADLWEPSAPVPSLALRVVAEDLLEIQGARLESVVEAVGFGDVEHHREVIADLVARLVRAGEADRALSVAEYARARTVRSGFRVLGDGAAPAFTGRLDGTPAELADCLSAYVRDLRGALGLPRRLDGAELRAAATSTGRAVLLLHPSASGLVRFLISPDGACRCDIGGPGAADLGPAVDELRGAIGVDLLSQLRGDPAPAEGAADLQAALAQWAQVEQSAAQAPAGATASDALERFRRLVLGDVDPPPGALVVVPYRELALVPYPALSDGAAGSLVDGHELSIAPGITLLTGAAGRASGRRRALVLAAPRLDPSLGLPALPRSVTEAEQVAASLSPVCDVLGPLTDAAASEEQLRELSQRAGILHLGCHAGVDAAGEHPVLHLAAGAHDDGRVRIEDVEDLRLDDALVVLAACQTGLGRATPDGVLGLGMAFRRAGARAVVLSLWRVGDASTEALMAEFYRQIAGVDGQPGCDAAAALARAQRSVRSTFGRVAQWGPWLVTGDGGWRLG